MPGSRYLTKDESLWVQEITKKQYPGRKVIKILAEKRQKRPVEEGLDILNVGLALMIETGELDLYYRVLKDEFDCFMDTYQEIHDASSGWIFVVTILEKGGADIGVITGRRRSLGQAIKGLLSLISTKR